MCEGDDLHPDRVDKRELALWLWLIKLFIKSKDVA